MKTAIITGSTKGIGEEVAKYFLQNEYFVTINGRSETEFSESIGKNSLFIKGDVSEPSTHLRLIEKTLEKTSSIDTYINCAGISKWNPIEKVSEDFWNELIDVNLKGTFFGCQAVAANMKKGGSIINISSLAGKRGSANNSVYCASKFGVNGITQALAKELGHRGIRVNAVCPVYVETNSVLKQLENSDSPSGESSVATYLEDFTQQQAALKRLPTGLDIAQFCFFLASENANAITGQCINIDCGVLPQ